MGRWFGMSVPMPEIRRFFGIMIVMDHTDHAPPHFLARYGSREAAIDIGTLGVIDGELRSHHA